MTRAAVSVMVTREVNSREVLLVKRSPKLKFLGGYLAFPGGTLDPDDEKIPVVNLPSLPDVNPDAYRSCVAAAARELFEETGIWGAGRGHAIPDPVKLGEYRRSMLDGGIRFSEILGREGQQVDAGAFTPVCRFLTPPFSMRRYDTWFLNFRVPSQASAEILPGELESGSFVTVEGVLESWRAGEVLIAPPVLLLLQELARCDWPDFLVSVRGIANGFQQGKLHPGYFSCGVLMSSLKTRTKPPATHTNFFAVGDRELYLVDPAAAEPAEQEKLWELLDSLVVAGGTLKTILLTHGHPDHVGAVNECRRRYGLPVCAHRLTADGTPWIQVDRFLEHGQELDLGHSPDGRSGWKLRVYHLPGHAPGHLAFQESRYGAVIVGDLVSTLSSILIDPSDGHLSTYLKSLQFLESIAEGVLYPGHGPPARQGFQVVQQALCHRTEREQQLLAALTRQPQPAELLTEKVYTDLDPAFMSWARRSLRSGLIKLMEEGRVQETAKGYCLVEGDAGYRLPVG